jgi:NAD(P)-dependent dehydrogenase (short-subunit alcohol dehydrogenase family)
MTDQVCIVTGSTGNDGTGSATIKLFAKKGWRVVVNYSRNAAAADAVAAECRELGAAGVLAIKADVTSDADCRRLAKRVEDEWGRCDVLVNNAATTRFVPHRNLDGLSGEDFQDIFNVNVTGVYLVTRALAPLLKKTGGASVVNISSMSGIRPGGSCMAYSVSKAALNMLTLDLSRVLAPEVRMNALVPGFITGDWLLSGMGKERYEAYRDSWIKQAPLGKVLSPAEVADAVWWLANAPGDLTGELVQLDGGLRLGRA